MKRQRRAKNDGFWFSAAIGVMIIMGVVLASCGAGGGYGSSGSTTYYYSITGTVTSGSTGLAGVTMTLGGAGAAVTTTDADGKFTFGNLVNGSYIITPSKTAFTFTPVNSAVTVSGANVTAIDFIATALPTFSISGTVTSGGTGFAGVTMTLTGSGVGTTTTDISGNYTLSGIVNGSYTVTPAKSGYTFAPSSSPQTVNSANIAGVDFTATFVQKVLSVACPVSGTTDVNIQNFAFSPASLSVTADTVVRWTNNDGSTHTVTSTTVPANGTFDSSSLTSGSSVCFKFTTTGTYNYHCSIHPSMTGSVAVP